MHAACLDFGYEDHRISKKLVNFLGRYTRAAFANPQLETHLLTIAYTNARKQVKMLTGRFLERNGIGGSFVKR